MGKYRVCGFCGKRNPISDGICSCNNLLINCPVFEDETDDTLLSKPADDNYSTPVAIIGTKFKKCPDCGHLNIPQLSCCEECGESLEDVFDIVDKPAEEEKTDELTVKLSPFHFVSTGGIRFNLPIGECIIGRDEQMGDDITKLNRMYVSSKHLIVRCSAQRIEVVDMSRNGTFLNSEKIPYGKPIPLSVGSILGLGGISEELDPHGYYLTLV